MNNENTCRFREYSEKIENKIDGIIKELHEKCTDDTVSKLSADAVEWSLASGGKRIRPVLALEFCRVCGGPRCRGCGGVGPADGFFCGEEP